MEKEMLVDIRECASPTERRKVPNATFAFIGDTHLGSTTHEGTSVERFRAQCELLVQNTEVNIVILSGDILDRNAGEDAIAAVEGQLKELTQNGKQIIYVWGNNEDRLQGKMGDIRQRFRDCGAHVLQEEEKATILDIPQEDGTTSQLAFVVASRIVNPEEQKKVMGQPDYLAQVLENRRILKESGRLEKFKTCLQSTVRPQSAYDEEGRLVRMALEAIPTIVLYHAPETLSLYQQTYSDYADYPEIQSSEHFTQAMIAHQKRWGNIIFGAFGHVEGGREQHVVEVSDGRNIPFINTCSIVTGGNFVIGGTHEKVA